MPTLRKLGMEVLLPKITKVVSTPIGKIAGMALFLLVVWNLVRFFWPSPEEFQGYVEGEYVYISSPVAGLLQHLDVQRGDAVQKGQRLFALERVSETAAQQEASEKVVQMEASLKLSELNDQRAARLVTEGAMSDQEADQTSASRQVAAAQKEAARAALTQAEWKLQHKEAEAPSAGITQNTFFRLGEWVPAGSPVVSLLPPENLKIRFFVPQATLSRLSLGQKVSLQADGMKETLTAQLSFFSPEAEYTPPVIYSKENRAKLVFLVEAKLDPETAAKLKVGQPLDVRLRP
jgi:HlyD family secretion protein